jgi:D-alanyl-D-alanine dipeptidase
MTAVGFKGLRHEWWHFEAFDVRTTRRRFSMVEDFTAP